MSDALTMTGDDRSTADDPLDWPISAEAVRWLCGEPLNPPNESVELTEIPVLAAHRMRLGGAAHGAFTSVDGLDDEAGIEPATIETIRKACQP